MISNYIGENCFCRTFSVILNVFIWTMHVHFCLQFDTAHSESKFIIFIRFLYCATGK